MNPPLSRNDALTPGSAGDASPNCCGFVTQTFLFAGSRNFRVPCFESTARTGDWKVPETRRLESLRYACAIEASQKQSANRRRLRPGRSRPPFSIAWFGLLVALATSIFPWLAQTAEKPNRNLLFIGQAKGYQHEAISTAMATLYNLGRSSGLWNTVLRTDCTAITKTPLKWEAKNLDAFDAIAFFTDGDLDMDASQKADLLSFVRDDGKGFIGIHSAAITFTGWPEYGQMLGGYFDGHPWGQFNAPLVVEDSTFPGMKNFPATFTLFDEVYQIKAFSRQNVRVLLSLDADKIDLTRKGVKRTDKDFAVIWAKNYGKGRVLYHGLGHVQAVWERPDFQKMWLEMVQWSMGLIPGDATPRSKPEK
jgi:type 1 glutamine amidotransferase